MQCTVIRIGGKLLQEILIVEHLIGHVINMLIIVQGEVLKRGWRRRDQIILV